MEDTSQLTLTISFDSKVYRLAAVKKAAYRFSNRGSSDITVRDDGQIQLVFRVKDSAHSLASLESDIRNEVLDQELREQIAIETAPIRNLIFAQAFSGLTLTDEIGERGDFLQDPLKIADTD